MQNQFNKTRFITLLSDLCSYKTVSANPDNKPDIEECCMYVSRLFTEAGFTVTRHPTAGNPVVVARYISDPAFQTIAVYNHMDVQPANETEWKTRPFNATVEADRIWARGASDDKGPALCAFLAAESCIADAIPLNFEFIWEFEEEIGSVHFDTFLREHSHEFRADSMLISDTLWVDEHTPTITYALRGLVTFEVSLQTAEHEVHSGTTGGVAVNPILRLAQILSQCADNDGRVVIPNMPKPHISSTRPGETDALFSLNDLTRTYTLKQTTTTDAKEAASRITNEPTFEIHGIDGGYTGPGVKTTIPPFATAKVSMRLVPGQDPSTVMAAVTAYLTKLEPSVSVTPIASAAPYEADTHDTYHEAVAAACKQVLGSQPAYIREGGSIGAVVAVKETLNIPIVMLGLSTPKDGYHEPNESFSLDQARQGVALFKAYFETLADH